MKHNFKLYDCGNWYDVFKCKRCGKELCFDAEDMVLGETLNELMGECLVGEKDKNGEVVGD